MWVVSISEHKMSSTSAAHLTLDDNQAQRLDKYIHFIRPQVDLVDEYDYVPGAPGQLPTKVKKYAHAHLHHTYTIVVPMGTTVRKV